MDILPNSETKSQIKKKRSCRSLAIANAAYERKQALIEIIRKSSRLLLVSDCLSSQKKKLFLPLISQLIPIFCGQKAVESARKYLKWLNVFAFRGGGARKVARFLSVCEFCDLQRPLKRVQ